MGSFKRNGRNLGPDRRRGDHGQRRRDLPRVVESLEERLMLYASTFTPTTDNLADVMHGPMANEGQDLINVYQAFIKGQSATQLAAEFPSLRLTANSVGVDLKGSGNFSTFVSTLTNLGMQITTTSAAEAEVEGMLPITALPTVAELPQTLYGSPDYKPTLYYQGVANNEGDAALKADAASTTYGVTGAGVTVGVLSDSVSQYAGGLADSYKTGDLSSSNPVKVIQDGPAGSTDEGRAMLENIHDIAPGANLAFATAANGELSTQQNIVALANAGAKVICDDVGYLDEPFFQDGFIAQGIDTVVAKGSTYFSAEGNAANAGYLSTFRATSASVASLGSGTYMNFNPGSGAAVTELPVTIGDGTNGAPISATNPAELTFEFDQPYAAQQPAGSTAAPTSQIEFYILDSSGNVVNTGNGPNGSSNGNIVAQGAPIQMAEIGTAGNYVVVIKVASGANPGHVEFVNYNENTSMTVSPQFGSAGGTYYPTGVGHATATSNIGVGAIPWWTTPTYASDLVTPTSSLSSEGFSSFGPAYSIFSPNGTALTSPVLVQTPVVTGPDGGNTSFFPPGGVIDTSNPPFPGQAATKTNLSQDLPSFFGTSSATPNVAAVAALMLQKQPTLTPAEIRAALITSASAQPMNGAAAGSWNVQGGYGLVNANAALASIDVLRVTSETPANNAVVTTTPTEIIFTFNKPVNLSTVTASDLTFPTWPGTLSVAPTVGQPIGIDDPKYPTQIAFPFTFQVGANLSGNGIYGYNLAGSILSEDGKTLQPFSGKFDIEDKTAPTVTNVTINGRIITVQFSKALAPQTINTSDIFVEYYNSVDGSGNPIWQNLNNFPGVTVTYNATTFTATLNYNALNQSQLPTGHYLLDILSGQPILDSSGKPTGNYYPGVTDLVGNKLDGEFSGVFPSGNGQPGGDFQEDLGTLTLAAPVITSLQLLPQYDTGIKGDENTNINMPTFIGQAYAAFPGTLSGLTVYAEFNSLHGGVNDLTTNGRGFTGDYDVKVQTDANGTFEIPAPFLPEGFTSLRLVVVAQPDSPPEAGLASQYDHNFRIDETAPQVIQASLTATKNPTPLASNTNLNTLTALSLDVQDANNPPFGALATPTAIYFTALDPTTASNISNYSLIIPATSTTPAQDYSRFIATAKFVATGSDYFSAPSRTSTSDPYYGRVDLTFTQGLPEGNYVFTAHSQGGQYTGITDAAGNPINETGVAGQTTADFSINFNIQPVPAYVVSVSSNADNAQGNTLLPYSYYEVNPRAGDIAYAPPTAYYVDFSNPINPATVNNNSVQIVGSANTPGGVADGDFGTLGLAGLGSSQSGTGGYTVVAGTTVKLENGKYGTNTRLEIDLPAGTTLTPDHYRLYIPNTGTTVLTDIYGNQVDGEFLGNATSSGTDLNGNPAYQDLLPTGQERPGMSGDGVAGGAFEVGFLVVPTGNVIYARPDYVEDPLNPATAPDGSLAKPYSVLAPQAPTDPNLLPAEAKATLNNGDPNGGLNDASNFLTGFDEEYDRAGIGRFARSAFYAASQLSAKGPVVIVALPGTPQYNPITGTTSQKTFVLQAPAGSDPVANDGSGSVPFDTLLAFNPGSTLKLENASLFVQNQGSSLQAIGGANPNSQVNFTSYANDAVAGDTNGDGSNTVPRAGDWGGIVFRNFDQSGRTDTFPVDVTLKGLSGAPAISGEDDALSRLNFATISYGGGAVPATSGVRYDEVMLYDSRPAITNDTIIGGPGGVSGSAGGSQAAISGDLDSFREDDLARGPLIRQTTATETSINGIWVRPLISTGQVQTTDAVPYPDNPVTLGGVQNYTFDSPLPYVFTSVMYIGQENLTDQYGTTVDVQNRLYIQPGMMLKFEPGAGIQVLTVGASLIVGDRTYITGWDAEATRTVDPNSGVLLPTSTYSPLLPDGQPNPNFVADTVGDAQVLFTSALDNTATTQYIDPITGVATTIVPAIDVLNTGGVGQPTPGNVPDSSRWGYISVTSGSYGIIDEATIRYAGGSLNTPGGTLTDAGALNFVGTEVFNFFGGSATTYGTRFMITNNNFTDNADVPMSITPDGLFAANTLEPLSSGHPYFRGNILQRNLGANGLYVKGVTAGGRQGDTGPTVDVNSLWDATDITYIVRESIVMGGFSFFTGGGGLPATSLQPEPTPSVVLTVQSALPGTLLADGSTIPNPGQSVIIKLDNDGNPAPSMAATIAATLTTEDFGGAGFIAGVDNGVDPTADPLIDIGNKSQMRFLGIGGNQTTGQQRIPVIITSIHDDTVGTTVRGVKMFTAIDGDTTAPAAGDGGLIYFGGNMLHNYNLLDPRAGSLMDNVDVSYITRIEMQGGGTITYNDLNNSNSYDLPDNPVATLGGAFPPLAGGAVNPLTYTVQDNTENALMISDSNLNDFLDAGVYEHHGFNAIAGGVRSSMAGEPNLLVMMNDTITNMPIGVQVIGDQNPDKQGPEANEFLALNDTFYNDTIGVDLQAIAWAPATPQTRASINFVAMDNIFDGPGGSTSIAVRGAGMLDGSQMQYNLFYNYASIFTVGAVPVHNGLANYHPIYADPMMVDPAAGNFQLTANSPAIDAARSELELYPSDAPDAYTGIISALLPKVTQELIPNSDSTNPLYGVSGVIDQTTRVPEFAQLDPNNPPTDLLTLPGYPDRGFVDEWVPVLATDPTGMPGPTSVPGSWVYAPALIPAGTTGAPGGGERDLRGYLRIDDPSKPNVGFGSRPFFDIGAYEYVPVYPPHVTQVTATPEVNNPNALSGFNLELLNSLTSASSIPTSGKNLVIVANVNSTLYFRIFDSTGLLIVDTNATNLPSQAAAIAALEAQLSSLWPPHVLTSAEETEVLTAVTSIVGPIPIDLYSVGGIAGTNQPIGTINVQIDHNLDPTTVNGDTVLLEASGGDGIFGNNNNPNDKFYNLSGKVSFNSTTNVLTINIGAAGLVLQSDEYRLFLIGTGSEVLRDPQGNALDGENTVNDDPNGAQLALPSGDGFPGGNFYDTFLINTQAPTVVSGSFQLDSSTDTNIVGDFITKDNLPAFSGTVKPGLGGLVPSAGMTVYLDVLSNTTNGSQWVENVGTATTNAQGQFLVTVGVDGANTGLVTSTSPLPDSPWTFNPATGKFGGYSEARVRVVDQSGNVSTITSASEASFIVDTAAPTITSFSPTPSATIQVDPTWSGLLFEFTTDKYIDPKSLNTSSILVTGAGADGILGTKDDVSVPLISGSIATSFLPNTATYTNTTGAELVTFAIATTVPNGLYDVTLKGTGASPIHDIPGNPLAGGFTGTFPSGQDGVAGEDFNADYLIYDSSQQVIRYVGAASYATDPAAVLGSRFNPYPTITAALPAAVAGDTIGVLPGVYTEQVTLKPFIKLTSAALSSTSFALTPGNAQETVIRSPAPASTSTTSYATVTATDLPSIAGFTTEICGFTIASPLVGNPATGPIDPNSTGVLVTNSSVLIDKDYIIDNENGVQVVTSGSMAPTPQIFSDGIIGNIDGVLLNDQGATSLVGPTQITNDTIAFNTIGVQANNTSTTPLQGDLFNNIFWQNHTIPSSTVARTGYAIASETNNLLLVEYNLFSGNGTSDTDQSGSTLNVGNGFDPTKLSSTPDTLHNFIGAPAFVAPRDPRPNGDGPGRFFVDADFDLTVKSAAIDSALNSVAPTLDFLYRGRVKIAGRGFPGTGPADIGAFEYDGSSGITVGGSFRVVTTSLATGGAALASGASFSAATAPKSITVTFSDAVNPSSVSVKDLILTGNGLRAYGGARAVSLTWVNNHTVTFNLSGGYNSTGTVNVSIAAGSILSSSNAKNLAFSDSIKISPTTSGKSSATNGLTPTPAPAPKTQPKVTTKSAAQATTALTPAPAPAPKGPSKFTIKAKALLTARALLKAKAKK